MSDTPVAAVPPPAQYEAAYQVYCREKMLDPDDTQSAVQFEHDWPTWSKP